MGKLKLRTKSSDLPSTTQLMNGGHGIKTGSLDYSRHSYPLYYVDAKVQLVCVAGIGCGRGISTSF